MLKPEEKIPKTSNKLPDDIDKMNEKRKKVVLIFLAVLFIIFIGIGISYAFWVLRINQDSFNIINTGCLNITLTDVDDSAIKLDGAYPISDEDGEALTPYTFKVSNTCDTTEYFNITLEIMNIATRLDSKYLAIDFNDTGKKLLVEYDTTTPTYSDEDYTAIEARELAYGEMLSGGETKEYTLKLWMDASVTDEESMNKSFESKISVTATQEKPFSLLTDYITTLAKSDTTNLVVDDTTDANTRYIGSDPDNYLCFDSNCTNGKWRVIGIMNNMTTAEGATKSLVKIIRATSIGSYVWDSNNINDWTTASLNTYLNETWYTANLTDYDNLIESVVWNLGGYSTNAITTSTFYAYERGTSVYEGRPTTWTGKVALMYPSDYGYATSGGDTGRETCLSYKLGSWNGYNDCYGNDFLYLGSNEWTLMPYSSYFDSAFYVNGSGYDGYYNVTGTFAVRPVGYLKSNAKILSGSGTNDEPWIISL